MESKVRSAQLASSTNDSIPLFNKKGESLHISINRERAHQMEDMGFISIKDNKAYKVK